MNSPCGNPTLSPDQVNIIRRLSTNELNTLEQVLENKLNSTPTVGIIPSNEEVNQDESSTSSFSKNKWNKRFIASSMVSLISMGIGTSMIFAHPFSGAAYVGVSMVSGAVAYHFNPPSDKKQS